jgi:hypothetical protein
VEQALTSEIRRKTPAGGKVSFEDFLEWADENTWAEWVDGVLPGFSLHPDWLWAQPLPKVLDVARELGLLD